MRAVLQRVAGAAVEVERKVVARTGPGLLALLAVGREDGEADADYLADKTAHLRVFPDEQGQMNLSVLETGGEVLVVSQFTLYGDCRRGRRPGYSAAAAPETAERLYGLYVERLRQRGVRVQHGVFRATMDVALVNRGPVTILLDSHKTF